MRDIIIVFLASMGFGAILVLAGYWAANLPPRVHAVCGHAWECEIGKPCRTINCDEVLENGHRHDSR